MTGVLAVIALAVPDLVFYGFLLFFVPGLTLALAPTAFMWGGLFALAYLAARKFLGSRASTIVALGGTAFILVTVPMLAALGASGVMSQYRLADVTPSMPIIPQGNVRLVQPRSNLDHVNRNKFGFAPYICDDRCLALLFEPGVLSVTITAMEEPTYEEIREGNSELHPRSLTYRLVPKSLCSNRVLDPDLGSRYGNFGLGWGRNTALLAEWGLKLITQYCLVGDPPIEQFDLLIRSGTWLAEIAGDIRRSSWLAYNRETKADYADILAANGTVLFRRFDLETGTLSAPLYISPSMQRGSPNIYFGWGSWTLKTQDGRDEASAAQNLGTALSVQLSSDPQSGLASARNAIRSVLPDADAKADDTALPLIETYLELLPTTNVADEDIRALKSMLADPLISDLPGAWNMTRKLSPDQLSSLLPAAVHKLATAPHATSLESVLGEQLANWPKGTFIDLSAEMLELLADSERRLRVPGLITRLSDTGKAGVPILTEIIIWHVAEIVRLDTRDDILSVFSKNDLRRANLAAVLAGMQAMCTLGPVAAAELPAMQEVRRQLRPKGSSVRDWDRMLLRLGQPPSEMTSPYSDSDEDYRTHLSTWLDRYDQDSCGLDGW